MLTNRNILLIRGLGGAGKTTLLHHLAAWWQTTGFVERVCYFGYDEKAHTRQQIMAAIARELLGQADYVAVFQSLSPPAQQALLGERLRAARHLLIFDNLESITGAHLAIQNTLSEEERERFHDFLSELAGGRAVVLLGSRGGEDWLARGTFGDNVYDLPGLDPEAASTLADRILERCGATRYRQDEDVQHILKLLDGYPLPLEVVLSNLARQTPAQVLAALQSGDEAIDMRSEKKTESILRCIDYSHSNLSPDAQQLLACLAPFTSVVYLGALEQYTAQLQQQPALAHLPFDRWQEVLRDAADWGLLSPHPQAQGYLRLQPILPYFLRSRLSSPPKLGGTEGGLQHAIETAFRLHYDELGRAIAKLLTSKEAQEKQLGQTLAHLEYENLVTALNLALEAQESISNHYQALDEYWDTTQDHKRGLELSATILSQLKDYPDEISSSRRIGFSLGRLLGDMGRRQLVLKQYEAAEESYLQVLEVCNGIKDVDEEQRGKWNASTYHQLGMVAQEQRQFVQAEQYYQQALEIYIEFNDRHHQATVYHQLGIVAQEQRQFVQARDYFLKDLTITAEFGDEHGLGITLRSLARLWQTSADAALPAAVAAVLGVDSGVAEKLLRDAT